MSVEKLNFTSLVTNYFNSNSVVIQRLRNTGLRHTTYHLRRGGRSRKFSGYVFFSFDFINFEEFFFVFLFDTDLATPTMMESVSTHA